MKVTTAKNQKVIAHFSKKEFEDLIVDAINNDFALCDGNVQEFKFSTSKNGGIKVEFFIVEG